MKRKNPTDTVSEHGNLMRSAPPPPPDHVHVPADAMPAWWAIVRAKAPDAWTPADLAMAAELARTFADLERLRREVREEGDVLKAKVNPKHKLADTLTGRAIRLTRLLQTHPLATQGRSGDQSKRNRAAREARETGESLQDDPLIPTGSERKH